MNEEPEYISESGDQWVSFVIDFARHSKPLVADGVLAKMELLLNGRMSQRDLTPAELKTVATELIGDMFPAPTEPEETR